MRKLSVQEKNHLIKFNPELLDNKEILETDTPVEYLTGKAEFYNNIFNVNQHTLIPRIETEKIIDLALSYTKDFKGIIKFCDIGCGSGAIGITFAIELLKRKIEFKGILSDISDEAINACRENLNLLKQYLGDKNPIVLIQICQSDLFEKYNSTEMFDLVFANLPYVPTARMKLLDDSVKNYEPHLALDGGESGAKIIFTFLDQAKKRVNFDSIILMEVDDTHDASFIELNKESLLDWKVEVINDEFGKNRFWVCRKVAV
jgi:release factor glutamine methyltransferase